MKKYYLFAFCALLLFVVTGCGKNQVVCSATMEEDGMTVSSKVIADLDENDKVTGVTLSFDLGDEDKATQYCAFMKLAESTDSGMKVDCSGSKITITGLESMDIDDDEENKVVGKTKEEFIKAAQEAEDVKYTCK